MRWSTRQSSTKAPKPIVDRAFFADGGYRLFYNEPWRDRLFEVPMQVCAHCSSHVVMNPERQRPRGHCDRCGRYVCDDCNVFNCASV